MKEDKPLPEADHDTRDDPNTEPRLGALQKTLHHIEAIKHILEASGIRPEPLELTLRNRKAPRQRSRASSRRAERY
jgi:hypothetical protein